MRGRPAEKGFPAGRVRQAFSFTSLPHPVIPFHSRPRHLRPFEGSVHPRAHLFICMRHVIHVPRGGRAGVSPPGAEDMIQKSRGVFHGENAACRAPFHSPRRAASRFYLLFTFAVSAGLSSRFQAFEKFVRRVTWGTSGIPGGIGMEIKRAVLCECALKRRILS